MSDPRAWPPETKSSGLRLVPPSVPPAPPAGGHSPPPPGPPSPDPAGGGSAVLARYFEECLNDLALIGTTLETLALFSDPPDAELEAEMRPLVADARLRLINRLQEIDCRVTDGDRSLSDDELRGFHRAMIDVLRRDMRWLGVETWIHGDRGSGSRPSPPAFRYSLPLRNAYDDPCNDSPTTLLRRILDDLMEEVSVDDHFVCREQFDRAVYRKFTSVLFACLVGVAPLLFEND